MVKKTAAPAPDEPERTLAELLKILKEQGPSALTPTELKFIKSQVRKKRANAAPPDAYEKKKLRQVDIGREKVKAGQDIGPPPPVKNLERKAAASSSLLTFLNTYFPHRFYLPWSADHIQVIERMEDAINNGGLFALAMSRASGKTSIVECACLWATLTGRHQFVLVIGSSREHALELMNSMKEELLANVDLGDDFPEVCFPIGELENRANRCKGQHIGGVPTKSVWSTDKIVFPTVEGSRASGVAIRVAGITGRVRGAKKETIRPSLCVLDDPQTDQSANSLSQCQTRARVINGAVLGLAGPGKKITVVMPCTVIRQGDLADTFLDREKSPLWTGQRFKMMYQPPSNMNLWEQYHVIRNDEFRNDGNGSQATRFYAEHRTEMDAGAVVAWPERHKDNELSGIQHAMNLLLADKWAFHAEYQNEPLSEDFGDGQLQSEDINGRVSGLPRGVVPLACSHVTAFVDVQSTVLFYLVAAWADDFTGSIIDYGTWPDQGRRYFTSADAQNTMARAFPGAAIEGQIHSSLGQLADVILRRDWPREDGASFRIERMLIDAGFQGDVIKSWCRTTQYAAIVLPSHGHGLTASSKPWSEYDRTRCERFGTHWLIPKTVVAGRPTPATTGRHVTIDVNYWKTFVAARLMQTVGEKGALTLYGKAGQDHRMIADHFCSEFSVATEGRGRKLREWRLKPTMTENHWWDACVGSAVAASMMGCSIMGATDKPAGPRKVIDTKAEQAARLRAFEAKRSGR